MQPGRTEYPLQHCCTPAGAAGAVRNPFEEMLNFMQR